MFKVAGPLWAQAAVGGDNVFARLVKTGKKVLRRVFQATEPAVGQREIPKPTWSLRARTIQFSESCTGRLVGGLFPKQVLKTQAAEARRRAALRLIRDSRKVPVFAFVGLSLGACSDYKNDHDVLCSGIRDLFRRHAVKQSGVDEAGQQFSLETLQLGSLIGKGCNAAVYEARPASCYSEEAACMKEEGNTEEVSPSISVPVPVPELPSDDAGSSVDPSEDDLPPAVFHTDEGTFSSEDSDDDFVIINEDDEDTKEFGTGSDMSSSTTSHDYDGWMMYRVSESSEPGADVSDSESDIFILAGDEEGLVSVPECEELSTVWMNLEPFRIRDHSAMADMNSSSDPSVSTDLSTSYSRISLGSVESSLVGEDSEPESSTSKGSAGSTCHENDFPLAVKMMFNYNVESQADRIFTAMARETVPVSTILAEHDFALSSRQLGIKQLPPHPNIVAMHGVFVDNTPELPGAAELYPNALPPRINNEGGLGRNATMFLVMKKYSMTLREYLSANNVSMRIRCLLFAQLLEGILHLAQHGIAHRDLKSDNILIDLSYGEDQPFLVISDFGSCLADERHGLQLPYITSGLDRGGNCALMAPEIKCAEPGPESVLDYTKADLWAAGALAYEIFGEMNPFYHHIDSRTYRVEQLPKLHDDVPAGVQELIIQMLKQDPNQRPSNLAAATVMQLFLWAPCSLHPFSSPRSVTSNALWKLQKFSSWLKQVTVATVCQRAFGSCSLSPLENSVKTTFLSRVSRSSIASVVALDS